MREVYESRPLLLLSCDIVLPYTNGYEMDIGLKNHRYAKLRNYEGAGKEGQSVWENIIPPCVNVRFHFQSRCPEDRV